MAAPVGGENSRTGARLEFGWFQRFSLQITPNNSRNVVSKAYLAYIPHLR